MLCSKKCGCSIVDPESIFPLVDRDQVGMVLFEEFSEWSTREHVKAVGDEYEPDESFQGLPKAAHSTS